jgi:hypothetical protein
MRRIAIGLVTVMAVLSGAASAAAAVNEGQAAFAKLQRLIGEWNAPLGNNEVMKNVFRPLAFGTALAHEEWKNGEQLTATVFYVVGAELRADHYCDMGHHLRYVAMPSATADTFHFALRDATNLDTHPVHFRSTTWRMIDADHLVQDWEAARPGKDPKTMRMEFKRTAARDMRDPEAVVRAEVHALNQGDFAARLALFSPDAKVFEASNDPNRLTGDLSATTGTQEQRAKFFPQLFAQEPRPHVELLGIASAGDLVVAKLRFSDHANPSRTRFTLALYRVRDGLIRDAWQLAAAPEEGGATSRVAAEVAGRLAEVNNRGDIEGFLALFSPKAKNFRNSGDPHALGDKPSTRVVDEKTRRDSVTRMFATGAAARVETLNTLALGNLVVAREIATLPSGKVVDEMSVYRVENGLIVHDWLVYEQARL